MICGNQLPKQVSIGGALSKITVRAHWWGSQTQNFDFVCIGSASHTDSIVVRHSGSNSGLPGNIVPFLGNNIATASELPTTRDIGIITIIILIERRVSPSSYSASSGW
jgi:hypothetical protein